MSNWVHEVLNVLLCRSSMGNCLRKHAQDPPQPPTGVEGVRLSCPRRSSRSLQDQSTISVLPSTTTCKNPASNYPLQPWNKPVSVPNLHKVSHNKDPKRYSTPATSKYQLDLEVNRNEVCRAYRLNCFCYRDLKAATKKFSARNLIGQGGFGEVYKGYIDFSTMKAAKPTNGRFAIAVKRLGKDRPQGQDEWLNEMRFLSRLNHPNIVQLLGYCAEGDHRILVYEYMTKGSLETHLFRENTELDWKRRIKIAIGAAKGLEYLHTRAKPVIHRDLKASNILLDADFNAKISDFGLARFGPQGQQTHCITRVLGTKGYFAPEYIGTGHLNLKTDVYSFGVVLLEILSGLGAVNVDSAGATEYLVQWAEPHLGNKAELHRVIDKKLGRNVPMEQAQEFSKTILRCLSLGPEARPTMTEVVADLEKLRKNITSYNTAHSRYLHTRR